MGDVNINAPLMQDAFVNHTAGSILHNRTDANTDTVHIATIEKDSQELIAEVCDEIKELLLEKNRKYGDSALNPTRIFAKSDSVEQIKVRIDDKLNRLKNAQGDEDEDVVQDLIGYLILLKVAQRKATPQLDMDFEWDKLPNIPWNPANPWNPHPWQAPQPWDRIYVGDGPPYSATWTINTCDDGHVTDSAAS